MVPQLEVRIRLRRQRLANEQVLVDACRKINHAAGHGDPSYEEYERRRLGWLRKTLEIVEQPCYAKIARRAR